MEPYESQIIKLNVIKYFFEILGTPADIPATSLVLVTRVSKWIGGGFIIHPLITLLMFSSVVASLPAVDNVSV